MTFVINTCSGSCFHVFHSLLWCSNYFSHFFQSKFVILSGKIWKFQYISREKVKEQFRVITELDWIVNFNRKRQIWKKLLEKTSCTGSASVISLIKKLEVPLFCIVLSIQPLVLWSNWLLNHDKFIQYWYISLN